MSTPAEIRALRLAKLETKSNENPQDDAEKQERGKDNNNIQQLNPNTKAKTNPNPNTVIETITPSPISLDRWKANELKHIFQVTLSDDDMAKNYIYLEDLRHELKSTDMIAIDSPDTILTTLIFEIGVNSYFISPLQYLFKCWSSANNSKRSLILSATDRQQKIDYYNEIMRLVSGYASILFHEPDTFIDDPDLNLIIDELISNIDNYMSFWSSILESIIDNETELQFLDSILPIITSKIKLCSDVNPNINEVKNYKFDDILVILEILCRNKQICSYIHQTECFNPLLNNSNYNGLQLELDSFLGRILRVSPLLAEISSVNYVGVLNKNEVVSINQSIATTYNAVLDRLFQLVNSLIRASSESRLSVLKFLSDLINKNHLRVGEHADPKLISTNSLMLNLTLILFKFSEPIFRNGALSKIDKVSIDYLNYSNKYLDITEETRINATIRESNDYYKDKMFDDSESLNFISQCFYLMLTYLNYGLGGIIVSYKRKGKMTKQLKEQMKAMEEIFEKKGMMTNPLTQKLVKSRLEPMEKKINKLQNDLYSIEMFWNSRTFQLEVFDSIIGISEFLVRLIDKDHKYMPEIGNFFPYLKMPLNEFSDDDLEQLDDIEFLRKKSPTPFKYFPEIYIEGLVNYCHFITRFNNNPMINNENKLTKLVEFSIIILRNPELISNPHLKARLTEVLFFGSLPLTNGSRNEQDGFMIPIFNDDLILQKNLLISLLYFYIMVEKTGSSSQFYDKFNSRYHISFIIEKLWKFKEYKQDLKRISLKYQKLFIKFIARMLNDTTYLLDESLNHLQVIHSCQKELNIRNKGLESTNEESDEDLQKKLDESERMAKSFVQLSNKTILLFNLFTKETPKSFTIVEIVDRLAGMLNYNLVVLVGPKYNQLKVSNPEKYQFDPKELLFQLCCIFNNLSKQETFVEAVARDLRSFEPENFYKAIKILKKSYKIPSDEWENILVTFVENAKSVRVADEEEELELGDVPDEFLDPLMYTLIKDPVKLPTSNISIDRSVLKAHLMNDPTDPFNRMPLKMEDVVDDLELRDKIAAWRQQQREKKASSRNADKAKDKAKDEDEDEDGDVIM